jgi:hypothetical protein
MTDVTGDPPKNTVRPDPAAELLHPLGSWCAAASGMATIARSAVRSIEVVSNVILLRVLIIKEITVMEVYMIIIIYDIHIKHNMHYANKVAD